MKDLRLVHLSKRFDAGQRQAVAVADVSLRVEQGQLVSLLGPSGCGKTTLLRMIAGFEEPSEGDIFFGARRVNDDPPNTRNTPMVFQSYAIFPHLDVFENVAFGLRLKGVRAGDLRKRVEQALATTGLGSMGARRPDQLSGGQQQRVVLARCIVTEPELMLFDEPLSNLDAKLREAMRVEIRELQQRLGIGAIYVTHDQAEAMSLSDRIVVMNAGRVEQVGSPTEIYGAPASRFVAGFVGKANFVAGVAVDARHVGVAGAVLEVAEHTRARGEAVTVLLRPESLAIADAGLFAGTIRRAMFLGSTVEYLVAAEGLGEVLVEQANPMGAGLLAAGAKLSLTPTAGVVVAD